MGMGPMFRVADARRGCHKPPADSKDDGVLGMGPLSTLGLGP